MQPTDEVTPMLVRGVRYEAEGVISLTLEPAAGGPLPEWRPGAHIDVVVGDGSTRQYSLSGDPTDRTSYRIAVLRESQGRGGSEHLHRTVRVGDVIGVRGPRNHFALEEAPSYVFVAGGIGITPLLPMIAEANAAGAEWALYYFGRTTASMAFLQELAGHGDRARVVTSVDRREDALETILKDAPSQALVYACGPARLTDELGRLLETRQESDRFRFELFVAPERPAGGSTGDSFAIRLERSGLDLVVPADRSILDVVTEAGIEVLNDCVEGICGSCETTVISGEVDHRDYVLTKQEKERNDCMMVCVSRANCPLLVLDL